MRLPAVLSYPLLALALAVVWILLLNDFTLGAFLFGLILGAVIPLFTRPFWPEAPGIKRYGKAIAYFLLVLWDIVVANVQVAYLILFRANRDLRSRFVAIPLDVRAPEAIALFAGTITMTPGTVSCDLAADGRTLLVHCLDVGDPAEAAAAMKARYEARLMEIFE